MESSPKIEFNSSKSVLPPKVERVTKITPSENSNSAGLKLEGKARAYLTEMAKQIPKVKEGSLTRTDFQNFVNEAKQAAVPEDQIVATLEANGVKVIRKGEANNEQETKLNLDKLESDLLLQEKRGGEVPTINYPDAQKPARLKTGGTRSGSEPLWWRGGRVDDENEDQLLQALKQRAREITSAIDGFGDATPAVDRMTFYSSGVRPGGMGYIAYDDQLKGVKEFWIDRDVWRLTAPELDRLLVHELLHVHDNKRNQGMVWTHSGSDKSWTDYRWFKRAESVFNALQNK